VHHPDEETLTELMEANLRLVTTKLKTVPNQHAGTATSMDIVKKTVARESEKMRPAK